MNSVHTVFYWLNNRGINICEHNRDSLACCKKCEIVRVNTSFLFVIGVIVCGKCEPVVVIVVCD